MSLSDNGDICIHNNEVNLWLRHCTRSLFNHVDFYFALPYSRHAVDLSIDCVQSSWQVGRSHTMQLICWQRRLQLRLERLYEWFRYEENILESYGQLAAKVDFKVAEDGVFQGCRGRVRRLMCSFSLSLVLLLTEMSRNIISNLAGHLNKHFTWLLRQAYC